MAFENEEANAEMRTFARNLRGMYVALVQEKFTQAEAMSIVSEVIRSAFDGNKGK